MQRSPNTGANAKMLMSFVFLYKFFFTESDSRFCVFVYGVWRYNGYHLEHEKQSCPYNPKGGSGGTQDRTISRRPCTKQGAEVDTQPAQAAKGLPSHSRQHRFHVYVC